MIAQKRKRGSTKTRRSPRLYVRNPRAESSTSNPRKTGPAEANLVRRIRRALYEKRDDGTFATIGDVVSRYRHLRSADWVRDVCLYRIHQAEG